MEHNKCTGHIHPVNKLSEIWQTDRNNNYIYIYIEHKGHPVMKFLEFCNIPDNLNKPYTLIMILSK